MITLVGNGKHPGGLQDLAPRRGLPRALLALLALIPLGLLGLLLGPAGREPASLQEAHLVGPRSPAPIGIVLLLDESGSFEAYSEIRELTLTQLATWAPDNLRPDDTITAIAFAADARLRMATVTVGELASEGPSYLTEAVDAGGTSIQPALSAGVAEVIPTGSTSIIAVTDSIVGDADPDAIARLVAQLDATSMATILPSGTAPTEGWTESFGWGILLSADPRSADDVAIAIGEALAHATGQRLEKSR